MEQHFTITTRHYVKTLERALKLYTPSLREKSLADFLATVCEDLGFRDIHTDDVGMLFFFNSIDVNSLFPQMVETLNSLMTGMSKNSRHAVKYNPL